jgi:hypothetical protein
MNTFASEKIMHNGKEYWNVQTQNHYCEDLEGLHQPDKSSVNISILLWNRLSYHIVKQFGRDFPQWVGVCVYRADKFVVRQDKELSKYGFTTGRIKYLFGVMSEREFLAEQNNFIVKHRKDSFEKYLIKFDGN